VIGESYISCVIESKTPVAGLFEAHEAHYTSSNKLSSTVNIYWNIDASVLFRT
jgi:hypothetical protein